MFDGDGCAINDGRINYSTSSIQLAKELQMMLLNFGIVVGYYPRLGKLSNNLNYLLDFGSDSGKFYSEIGFKLERKQERKTLVRNRLSENIPHQKLWFDSLYKGLSVKEFSRDIEDDLTFNQELNKKGVRRDTIQTLVNSKLKSGEDYSNPILSHFGEILLYDCVWLQVKSIEDGGICPTFDLHVPSTNAYIANGLIVHNTYEDLDLCLTIRGMGYNIVVEQNAIGHHFTGASALANNMSFPLGQNKNIFMARWKSRLEYTEWRYW